MTTNLYLLATGVVISTLLQVAIIYWAFRKYGNIPGTTLLIFAAVFTALSWILFVISSFEVHNTRMTMITVALWMKIVGVLSGCVGFYLWGRAFREF